MPFLLLLAGAGLLAGLIHQTVTQLAVPYGGLILEYASKAKIPHSIAIAQVKTESSFNHSKRGLAGEVGLLQILPAALTDVNRKIGTSFTPYDLTNVRTNLLVGFTYLQMQYKKYGSYTEALSAYNSGRPDSTAGLAYASKVLKTAKEY